MASPETAYSWVQLVAAVGVGSITAAVVGWWSAKAVAISNHRQNWINALRDDLSNFLKEVDVLHYRWNRLDSNPANPSEEQERFHDARNAAMLAYRRILMRLNMDEALSVELADRLFDLMMIKKHVADADQIDAVLAAARRLLRQEWAVTKYGVLTPLVLKMKRPPAASVRPLSNGDSE